MNAMLGGSYRGARRGLIALALASCALLIVPTGVPRAHAEWVGCRSDPAVVLANGVIVDLSADITDAASDVQNVAYTLHVPTGTAKVIAINTSLILGPRETFSFVDDQPPGQYYSTTKVTTGTGGVAISANTTVIPLLEQTASGTANGQAPQALTIHLST
jgi:hypothetical protein